jgi:hypothetical protein
LNAVDFIYCWPVHGTCNICVAFGLLFVTIRCGLESLCVHMRCAFVNNMPQDLWADLGPEVRCGPESVNNRCILLTVYPTHGPTCVINVSHYVQSHQKLYSTRSSSRPEDAHLLCLQFRLALLFRIHVFDPDIRAGFTAVL